MKNIVLTIVAMSSFCSLGQGAASVMARPDGTIVAPAGLENRLNTINSNMASAADSLTNFVNQQIASATGNISMVEHDANALARIAEHTNRTDNPHGVTAAQIGALRFNETNGWEVGSHAGFLTTETDAVALGVLATTRVDRVYGVTSTDLSVTGDGILWAYIDGEWQQVAVFATQEEVYGIKNQQWWQNDVFPAIPDSFYAAYPDTSEIVAYTNARFPQVSTRYKLNTQEEKDVWNSAPSSNSVEQMIASKIWTNMVWSAAGTNSHFIMTWDATNGTFDVLEVTP